MRVASPGLVRRGGLALRAVHPSIAGRVDNRRPTVIRQASAAFCELSTGMPKIREDDKTELDSDNLEEAKRIMERLVKSPPNPHVSKKSEDRSSKTKTA